MEQMTKVLILGATSFVADGFADKLRNLHYSVDEFSRGNNSLRSGNIIKGVYTKINQNVEFAANYDIVVDFAVLKNQSVDDNIVYAQALVEFCKIHKVKKLIHFSTIMNYNYHLKSVDECTPIEALSDTDKKGYAELKIAVDQYLISVRESLPFELVLVRPGYVLAGNRPCPFIKKLPLGFSIIKGNKKSKQPIVKRDDIHKALLQIINTESNDSVYHFFPNNGMTKYRYAKESVGGFIITMPKCIFKWIPSLLCKLGCISKALYSRFDGMYIESDFDSSRTEQKLKIKFS